MGSALPIIAGATGLLSLVQGGQAASGQRRAARAQESVARNQRQLFAQTTPYYGSILEYLSRSAGLQPPTGAFAPNAAATPATTPGGGTPASSAPLPAGSGALPDSALGIFAQNPDDRLRFQAAEEDLARLRDVRANQLTHALGRRGAGSATTAAALARNEGDYQQQTAAFRRQLALAARAEQERRVGALLQALSPGLGAGNAAASIFGGQAGMYGNQVTAAGAGVGNLLSNWLLAEAMRRQNQGTNGGIAGYQDPAGLMALLRSQDPSYGGY